MLHAETRSPTQNGEKVMGGLRTPAGKSAQVKEPRRAPEPRGEPTAVAISAQLPGEPEQYDWETYDKMETKWEMDPVSGEMVPILGQEGDSYYPEYDYDYGYGDSYNNYTMDDEYMGEQSRVGMMDMVREIVANRTEINFQDPEFYMEQAARMGYDVDTVAQAADITMTFGADAWEQVVQMRSDFREFFNWAIIGENLEPEMTSNCPKECQSEFGMCCFNVKMWKESNAALVN